MINTSLPTPYESSAYSEAHHDHTQEIFYFSSAEKQSAKVAKAKKQEAAGMSAVQEDHKATRRKWHEDLQEKWAHGALRARR